MRFFLFLFGLVVGAGGVIAYGLFGPHGTTEPARDAMPRDPALSVTVGPTLLAAIVHRESFQVGGIPIQGKDLQVSSGDGEIVVGMAVQVLGKDTKGQIALRPEIDNGHLKIRVTQSGLAGLALPAVGDLVEKQIDARIRALFDGTPITFTAVRVDRNRGMTVACAVDVKALDAVVGSR